MFVFTACTGEAGTGVLNINAENEGLDSELHLTINGGIININSGNDGINTNEDGVSVTTINGGTVVACGSMLDRIEDGGQPYVTFSFMGNQGTESLTIKDSSGETVVEIAPENDCSMILYSSQYLNSEETYALYNGDTLVSESSSDFMGGPGGMMPPGGHVPPEGEPPHWG